ncbi:hypothetical protein RZS08_36380, partial [Arthrospira platensis SPKY1]|nr:hypothetical protein [Arthrospira platensis SPKY1]
HARSVDRPSVARRHKYDGGAVLIIGSHAGYTGATVMAAKAAWAAGASAVFVAIPAGLGPIFDALLPEAVKLWMGTTDDLWLKAEHLEALQAVVAQHQGRGSVLIGPGFGREAESL